MRLRLATYSGADMLRINKRLWRAIMADEAEGRRNRALAIACASVSFRGVAMDVETLLSLADEYLDYIEGDDGAPIPRPDKTGASKS